MSIEYIVDQLNIESSEECIEKLLKLGCVLDEERLNIKLKESKQAVCESKLLEGGFD